MDIQNQLLSSWLSISRKKIAIEWSRCGANDLVQITVLTCRSWIVVALLLNWMSMWAFDVWKHRKIPFLIFGWDCQHQYRPTENGSLMIRFLMINWIQTLHCYIAAFCLVDMLLPYLPFQSNFLPKNARLNNIPFLFAFAFVFCLYHLKCCSWILHILKLA